MSDVEHLFMCFLAISSFLKEISIRFHSILFPLFLSIVHIEGFFKNLSLLFSGTLHSVWYIFPFLPSLLFYLLAVWKASSDNHLAFLNFFLLFFLFFFQKKSSSASLTMLKPLIMCITTNCGIFLKRWEYRTTSPASWEICMQDKKQQLELDMEEWTGSKLGKEYVKAVYCHPAYLTYIWITSYEMLDWMTHKLEARLWGEISATLYMQMIPL